MTEPIALVTRSVISGSDTQAAHLVPGPGTVAVLPRHLRHAYAVTSAMARLLTLHTPAGFERTSPGCQPGWRRRPHSGPPELKTALLSGPPAYSSACTSRSSHTRSRSSMPSMRRPGGYPVAGVKASRSTERIRKPCRW